VEHLEILSRGRKHSIALSVYSATRTFPREETYGLTIQLRRAAVSVVSNIAEGKGRSSDKELLQFLSNAKGSLFEVETQLELAKHLSYLSASQAETLASKVNETGRLLNGLMRAFRPPPPNATEPNGQRLKPEA
jgi:four helix bundle protein